MDPALRRALALVLRAARGRFPLSSDPVAVLALFDLYERDRRARADLGALDAPGLRAEVWRFLEDPAR